MASPGPYSAAGRQTPRTDPDGTRSATPTTPPAGSRRSPRSTSSPTASMSAPTVDPEQQALDHFQDQRRHRHHRRQQTRPRRDRSGRRPSRRRLQGRGPHRRRPAVRLPVLLRRRGGGAVHNRSECGHVELPDRDQLQLADRHARSARSGQPTPARHVHRARRDRRKVGAGPAPRHRAPRAHVERQHSRTFHLGCQRTDSGVIQAGDTRLEYARTSSASSSSMTSPAKPRSPVRRQPWSLTLDTNSNLTGETLPAGTSPHAWPHTAGRLTGSPKPSPARTSPPPSPTTARAETRTKRPAPRGPSRATTTPASSKPSAHHQAPPPPTPTDVLARAPREGGHQNHHLRLRHRQPAPHRRHHDVTYDTAGRRLTSTTVSNPTTYTYDPAGRLATLTVGPPPKPTPTTPTADSPPSPTPPAPRPTPPASIGTPPSPCPNSSTSPTTPPPPTHRNQWAVGHDEQEPRQHRPRS